MTHYDLILTTGYTDDSESSTKGYRSDALLKDQLGNYYELNFVELEVIQNGFDVKRSAT